MRKVMQFQVYCWQYACRLTRSPIQATLVLPAIAPLTPTVPNNPRKVSLNEEMSRAVYVPFDADADEFVLDTNGTLWEVAHGCIRQR